MQFYKIAFFMDFIRELVCQ